MKPNQVRELPGGLDAIVPEGFPLIGAGNVSKRSAGDGATFVPLSAEKVVYHLVEK